MAADQHPEHPAAKPQVGRAFTHECTMTTRSKRLIETPYEVVVEVEDGKAVVVSMVDATHAYLVADDKPGRAMVSVTPIEPHEDYVPAMILCHVAYPLTTVVIGEEEAK